VLQKSAVDSSSDEGLKPDSMNGMIELKNVMFRYPSREQVPVINVPYICDSVFHIHVIFCRYIMYSYDALLLEKLLL